MGARSDPLKLALGFLLKMAVRILRGYYLITDEDPEQCRVKSFNNFLKVLSYHWNNTFGDAQSAIVAAKQEKLR